MIPHPTSPKPVRASEPVDGFLLCWRCESRCDADGYCCMCGAVTVPVRKPPATTAEPSRDDRAAAAGDPFDALVGPTAPGCEVCGLV